MKWTDLWLDHDLCRHCQREERKRHGLGMSCLCRLERIDGERPCGPYTLYFPYLYTGLAKEMMHAYKFKGRRYYADIFVSLIEDDIRKKNPDVLIGVPLSKGKKRFRGFDQNLYLLDRLSEKTGIPHRRAVIKTRETRDQHLISTEEKTHNLQDAFQATEFISEKRILLFDDIATTGRTLLHCARALDCDEDAQVFFYTVMAQKPIYHNKRPRPERRE